MGARGLRASRGRGRHDDHGEASRRQVRLHIRAVPLQPPEAPRASDVPAALLAFVLSGVASPWGEHPLFSRLLPKCPALPVPMWGFKKQRNASPSSLAWSVSAPRTASSPTWEWGDSTHPFPATGWAPSLLQGLTGLRCCKNGDSAPLLSTCAFDIIIVIYCKLFLFTSIFLAIVVGLRTVPHPRMAELLCKRAL